MTVRSLGSTKGLTATVVLILALGISIGKFGDFSTIGFTMVGLGESREVRPSVVGGSYFEVMGLHAVLGRLLDMRDDPSKALEPSRFPAVRLLQ